MDFLYARIVCSRVAAPMRPVCHRAVTAMHQCAMRTRSACPCFAGTTKVSISVHAPAIVDTHMLTKILLKLLWSIDYI